MFAMKKSFIGLKKFNLKKLIKSNKFMVLKKTVPYKIHFKIIHTNN